MTRWALVVWFATLLSLNSAGFQEDSDIDGSGDNDGYADEVIDENDVTGPFLNATATKTDGNKLLARRAGPPKQMKQKIWKDIRREVRDMKNNILPVLAGNISFMELDVRDMNRNFFSMIGDVRFMKNEILYIKQQAHVIWENVTDTRRDHKRMNKTLWSILNNVTLVLDHVENAVRRITEMRDSYSKLDERLDGAIGKLFEISSVPKLIDDMNKRLGKVVDVSSDNSRMSHDVNSVREIVGHVAQTMGDMKQYIVTGFLRVDEDMSMGEHRILANVSEVNTKIATQDNTIKLITDNVTKLVQTIFEVLNKLVAVWDILVNVGTLVNEIGTTIISVDKRIDGFEDEMRIINDKIGNVQRQISDMDNKSTAINISLENVHHQIISNFGGMRDDLDQMKGNLREVRRVISEKCKGDFNGNDDYGEVLPDHESSGWSDGPEVSPGWDPTLPDYPTNDQYPTHPQSPSYPDNGYPTSTPRYRPTPVWPPTSPWEPPTAFPATSPPWQPTTEHLPWPSWQPTTVHPSTIPGQPPTVYPTTPPPWQPITEHPTLLPWQPTTIHPSWPPWQPTTAHPSWLPWQPTTEHQSWPPWQPTTEHQSWPPWQPTTAHPSWRPWQPTTEHQSWPPWQPTTEHPSWPPWQPTTVHPSWPPWQPTTEHPSRLPWQPTHPTLMPPIYPPSTIFPTTPGHLQIPIHPGLPPSHVPPIGGPEGPPAPAGPDQHVPGMHPSTGRPMWPSSPPLQDDARWLTQLPLGPQGPGLPIGCGHQLTGHCACACPCDCVCPAVQPGALTFTTSRYDRFTTTGPSANTPNPHKKCYCLCECPCPASTTIGPLDTERPVVPPFQPLGIVPGHGPPHERPWPGLPPEIFPTSAPPGWAPQPDETLFLNMFNELIRGSALMRQDLERMAHLIKSKHELTKRTIISEFSKGFEYIMREMHSRFDTNIKLCKEGITLTRALQMQLSQAVAKAVYSLEAIAMNILEFHREFSSLLTISPPVSDRRPGSHSITVQPLANGSELQPPDFTPPGQAPSYVPSKPIDRPDGRPQLILPGHSSSGSAPAGFPEYSLGQSTLRPLAQLVGERPPGRPLGELIGRPPPRRPQPWFPAQYPVGPDAQYFGQPQITSGPRPGLSYRSIPRRKGNSQWIMGRKLTNNVTATTTEVSLSSEVARRMLPNEDEGKKNTKDARKSGDKKKKKTKKGCVISKKYINAKQHSPRLIGDQDLVLPNIEDETDEEDYDESIQEVDERDVDVMPKGMMEMPNTEMVLPEEDMGMIRTPVDPFAFHNLLQEHINNQLMNAIQPNSVYRVKGKRLPSGRWHGRTRNRYKMKPRPIFPIMPGFPFIQPPVRLRPPIPPAVFPKPITIRRPRIPNIFGQLPPGMMVAGISGSPYSASYNDGRGNSWNVNVNRRNYSGTKAKLNREHKHADKEEHEEDEEEKLVEKEHKQDYEEREK